MDPWILLAAGPVAAATLALAVMRRCFVVVTVTGTSMTPALKPGDRVLVRRGARDMVQSGRIVVFGQPRDECLAWSDSAPARGTIWMIKRVAAAGGEAVPDVARPAVGDVTVVPPGMLVVLGDNLGSTDSRTWGFLPAAAVRGVAVRRLKPSGSLRRLTAEQRHDARRWYVRIDVLGPIQVTVQGRTIRLAGQRQRALLAALTLELGKVVPVDRLVDILWDVNPPPTARVKVQAHVSALRQAIGHDTSAADGPLPTRPPGYVLCREGVELDLAAFDGLMVRAKAAAESRQPADASELFGAALAIWQGSAFADVRSLLIRSAADSLEDRRLLACEAKAEADLALGRSDRVVAELPQWLAAHPFRERMRGMLMLALYRLGCRADALALYRDGHQLMVAELGLEPGPPLRALHQHVLADDPRLLAQPGGLVNGTAAAAARA